MSIVVVKSPELPQSLRCSARSKARGVDLTRGCVATFGTFDGLHLGHRELVEHVLAAAAHHKLPPVVISLWPHPRAVLSKRDNFPPVSSISGAPAVVVSQGDRNPHFPNEDLRLSTLHQQCALLEQWGVEALFLLRFTVALSTLTADAFISHYLVNGCGVRHLVVGADAAIGRRREGTADFLKTRLPELGIECEVVPFKTIAGAKIGSGEIRKALDLGDVDRAREQLGRAYSMYGRVKHGDGRGATIGFSTANLACTSLYPPKSGVYATHTLLHGKRLPSVTNVGRRPTFEGVDLRVETHILDLPFSPLYGAPIEVEFNAILRDERKFHSVDELRTQIEKDVRVRRNLLG